MIELPESFHRSSYCLATLAADLLQHYSFELASEVDEQINAWLETFPEAWLPIAIIEALYQGRYKAISVEQILIIWQRRGQPVFHFNHEFERLVCSSVPRSFEPAAPSHAAGDLQKPTSRKLTPQQPALSYRRLLLELPSVRAVSKLERLSEIPALKLTLVDSKSNAAPRSAEVAATATNGQCDPQQGESQRERSTKTAPERDAAGYSNGDREFKDFKQGVAFGLSSGLATSLLKPRFRLELSRYYQPNWLKFLDLMAIEQFTPAAEPSEFHSRLKSVAQPSPLPLARSQSHDKS